MQKAQMDSHIRIKGILIAGLLLLSSLILLFPNVFIYTEPDYGISVPFSGWKVAFMLLTGTLTQSMQIGKMKAFELSLPTAPALFVTVAALLFLLLCAWVIFRFIVRQKNDRSLGWVLIFCAVVLLVGYGYAIISSSLTTISRSGKEVAFYQAYDINVLCLMSALLAAFAGTLTLLLKPERMRVVKRFWFCYLLLVVPTLCMLVFNFYPILLQCVIAFKNYKLSDGIWGSDWVGLDYFRQIFTDPSIRSVIFTSVKLSMFRMTVSIIPPLVLAVFMFDMGLNRYRKVVQTIVYIPHFFSWVIIYGVFYALLSNTGIVNQLLKALTGNGNYYVDFLTNKSLIIPILLISQVWKEIGWGTILYLAALSNVDATLYEASALDGAGPLQRLFHITIPSIMSVIVFLCLMQIGSILSNGLDQILLFANLAVRDQVNTIELWVYQNGIGKLDYGLASAVGFFQSLIGLALVLSCNKLSTKTVGRGLF